MSAIPSMTILVPADADEMNRLMPQTVEWQGPIYIRLAKGYDPIVSREDIPFEIGRAIAVREGGDILILTTGITLGPALEAAQDLSQQGIEAAILHLPTVKPLDRDAILSRASMVPAIVTIEENTVVGGLGSAVAESPVPRPISTPSSGSAGSAYPTPSRMNTALRAL